MVYKFATAQEFIAYLEALNPDFKYYPPGFDYRAAACQESTLLERLRNEFGSDVQSNYGVQDATFHLGIYLPTYGELRFSNFANLVAITSEELIPPLTLTRIVQTLEECGFTHVPWRLFGEPFPKRELLDDGLWGQLFDYV